MRRRKLAVLAIMAILFSAPFILAEEKKKPSTYETLRSILGKYRRGSSLKLTPQGRDLNLIEPQKGAGGVLFGQRLDEVMAVWGKPSRIVIHPLHPTWCFYFHATRFEFYQNSLVSICIHNVNLPNAHFENGINFSSTLEECEKAFGKPQKTLRSTMTYLSKSGYEIHLHFMSRVFPKGSAPKLITVRIVQPEDAWIQPKEERKCPTMGILNSIVRQRKLRRRSPLVSQESDLTKIDPETGAGGVRFGQSLDEVMKIWGKPEGIEIRSSEPGWVFRIRASRFQFIRNKLILIALHCIDLEDAHFANGISFQSTPEEVKSSFGTPIEEKGGRLRFAIDGGYQIGFYFSRSYLSGKLTMLSIRIEHPGFD